MRAITRCCESTYNVQIGSVNKIVTHWGWLKGKPKRL